MGNIYNSSAHLRKHQHPEEISVPNEFDAIEMFKLLGQFIILRHP